MGWQWSSERQGPVTEPWAPEGFELWLRAGMVKLWEGFEHKKDSLPYIFTKFPCREHRVQGLGGSKEACETLWQSRLGARP